jgi:type III pantothenate kinase
MLFDIGNTNISYFCNGKYSVISTNIFTSHENVTKFFVENNVKTVVFASVVPVVSNVLVESAKELKIKYREITIDDVPIQINIKNKNQLGIDRAINACVALKKFGNNVIVVDFGTALTFDIVYNGIYEGGMIFPGLTMAMYNLHTKTAKLPDVKITEYITGIGKNTVEAISFGACIGYQGVLKEILLFIKNFYNTEFRVIFTGGSGKLFYKLIENAIFEESLILDFLQSCKID